MSEKAKENSAIEEIYSISEKLDLIIKRLDVLDTNIKLLNNKQNKLSKKIGAMPTTNNSPGATQGPPSPSATAAAGVAVHNVVENKTVSPARSKELVVGNIKLFGHIHNKNKEPLIGVEVRVYNNQNQIIKEKKSDSNGHWSVRLPPGKYGVEYIHEKFKPVNRTVNLDGNAKEHEVK